MRNYLINLTKKKSLLRNLDDVGKEMQVNNESGSVSCSSNEADNALEKVFAGGTRLFFFFVQTERRTTSSCWCVLLCVKTDREEERLRRREKVRIDCCCPVGD
ncbi:uncharacterized protein DS421_12g379440 [Arachis hypogaea]|nr:uncharacterized protein DS421_12g379440 [Arachis hypogaea]